MQFYLNKSVSYQSEQIVGLCPGNLVIVEFFVILSCNINGRSKMHVSTPFNVLLQS